jgi:hypothetical protein
MGHYNRALKLAGAAALGLALLASASATAAQDWGNWETWSGRYIGPHREWRCDGYGACWQVTVRGHDRYAGRNIDGTPRRRHARRHASRAYGRPFYPSAYPSQYGDAQRGYPGGAYDRQGYQDQGGRTGGNLRDDRGYVPRPN